METIDEEVVESKEKGLFSEIFRRIWKRKWAALAIAVAVVLIATLAFMFIINPMNASYTISFDIVYPGSETLKYPSGTPFYYQDMVSEGYLEKAKAQDERFANIDVEKLVDENGLSVEAEKVNGTPTGKYTLTVKASYFSNKSLANDFIKTLARVPELYVKETAASVNYTVDSKAFADASFESQLELLSAQKNTILEQFDLWIGQLGGTFGVKVEDKDRTLMAYRAEIAVVFDAITRETLEKELQLGGYVPVSGDENAKKEQLKNTRTLLKEEYEVNEKTIAELKKAHGTSTVSLFVPLAAVNNGTTGSEKDTQVVFPEPEPTLSQMLAKLIARNEEIRYQLGSGLDPETEEGALTVENITAFSDKLTAQYNALTGAAETAKKVSASLYDQQTYTRFEKTNVEKTGGTSTILVVVASLVVGVILAGVVAYALESLKQRKANAPAEASAAPEEKE